MAKRPTRRRRAAQPDIRARELSPEPPRTGAAAGRITAGETLVLGVFFALAAATLELVARGVLKVAFGRVMLISRDAIWMAPLGQLLLFLPLALLLIAAGLVWKRAASLRAAVLVFGFVAALGLLLIPALRLAPAVLLAAGLAYRLAISAARRRDRLFPAVRRGIPAIALVLAVPAGVVAAGRKVAEWRGLHDLPPARAEAPNVILLIWDTVRATSLSLYGHERPTTPNLERLAQRGVVFERAIAPAPWTLPAHASFFTGYLPHRLTAGWRTPLSDEHPILAEVFRAAGYRTGAFAANLLYTDWEHGLARGFLRFEDYRVTPGQIFLTTSLGRMLVTGHRPSELALPARLLGYRGFVGRKTADMVDRDFLTWLDAREGRPFFAFLNYFDAHFPYYAPPTYEGRFGPRRGKRTIVDHVRREIERKSADDVTADELVVEHAAYEAAIAYLDARLGELIGELERRGLMENTLLIVASDHGEEFREHGVVGHGANLYLPQVQVPLVIVQPGRVPAGARVEEPVSLADLPATIARLTGLEHIFPGRSLAQTWLPADTSARHAVLSELVPGSDRTFRYGSVILDRYQYIRNPRGRRELYDIVADPGQEVDLATSADGALQVWRFDAIHDLLFRCREFDCCCTLPAGRLSD